MKKAIRIIMSCLVVRDWFETRDTYYESVNTNDYGTKIMLMNKLHNR